MSDEKAREMLTIELADGDMIYGEYQFMAADNMDDWTVAEEDEFEGPVEYVITRWIAVEESRKTFGETEPDDDE